MCYPTCQSSLLNYSKSYICGFLIAGGRGGVFPVSAQAKMFA